MNKCGCNNPIPEKIEFEISNNFKFSKKSSIIINNNRFENIEELKNKVICEYLTILDKLECGIHSDLEFLLEEISLIDILNNE